MQWIFQDVPELQITEKPTQNVFMFSFITKENWLAHFTTSSAGSVGLIQWLTLVMEDPASLHLSFLPAWPSASFCSRLPHGVPRWLGFPEILGSRTGLGQFQKCPRKRKEASLPRLHSPVLCCLCAQEPVIYGFCGAGLRPGSTFDSRQRTCIWKSGNLPKGGAGGLEKQPRLSIAETNMSELQALRLIGQRESSRRLSPVEPEVVKKNEKVGGREGGRREGETILQPK